MHVLAAGLVAVVGDEHQALARLAEQRDGLANAGQKGVALPDDAVAVHDDAVHVRGDAGPQTLVVVHEQVVGRPGGGANREEGGARETATARAGRRIPNDAADLGAVPARGDDAARATTPNAAAWATADMLVRTEGAPRARASFGCVERRSSCGGGGGFRGRRSRVTNSYPTDYFHQYRVASLQRGPRGLQ